MSTIKVNKIENTATANGGIAIDASGHVQVDDVQMPTAGQLSNRNLIINGAMKVAQRGSSSTSSGYQTVDRFKTYHTQVSVTQSRQTLSSGSPYDEGFRFFLRMANTSTSSSTASQASIQYRFEAQDLASSGWNYKSSSSYATFSFWVRSSLAGTYYISYRNTDANPLTYNASFTLVADTWTKVTQTIPGDSNVVFNSDNGEGMRLSFVIHFGTDNTGSNSQVDAWHDRVGNDYLPDFAQNWSNTSGATFDVTGVQFEVGEKATPFEHRSINDEVARCQRYYYRTTASTNDSTVAVGFNQNSSATRSVVFFPVRTRTAPTALEQSGTASDLSVYHGTSLTTCSSVPSFTSATQHSAEIQANASGLTAGQGSTISLESTGYLAWSAEL